LIFARGDRALILGAGRGVKNRDGSKRGYSTRLRGLEGKAPKRHLRLSGMPGRITIPASKSEQFHSRGLAL